MRLENAKITSLELKSGATITLTVGTVTNEYGELAFSHPMVQSDFENYISKYEYGDGLDRERRNTELIKENEELKEKVKDLELVIGSERKISEKLREDVNALCDGQVELQNDLRKSEIERAKLEKDLMSVADILQVGGLRSVNDILDKAHYWVHERSIDDEELKMILRMDLDASREDILDRIDEVVKKASECEMTRLALMNVYNACLPAKMNLADDCTAMDISKEIVRVITNKEKLRNMDAVILGDFLSFRDKVKKMVGCESNECSEILDVLKRHLKEKKELSGKLEMLCRFRDDVVTVLGIDGDWSIDDVLNKISRDVRLARKAEFICEYFDVKQVPLTSLAENLCIEIKEKVISVYKKEVEEKKAGSVGNGVYLDGQTVEQNLRAENLRLKAEREKYKEYIAKLEKALDTVYEESAAALGYECE